MLRVTGPVELVLYASSDQGRTWPQVASSHFMMISGKGSFGFLVSSSGAAVSSCQDIAFQTAGAIAADRDPDAEAWIFLAGILLLSVAVIGLGLAVSALTSSQVVSAAASFGSRSETRFPVNFIG